MTLILGEYCVAIIVPDAVGPHANKEIAELVYTLAMLVLVSPGQLAWLLQSLDLKVSVVSRLLCAKTSCVRASHMHVGDIGQTKQPGFVREGAFRVALLSVLITVGACSKCVCSLDASVRCVSY